jgi:hypothetical protein
VQHTVDVADPGDEIRIATGAYTDVHTRPPPPGYQGPAAITQAVYLSKSLVLRGGYTTTAFAGPPDPEAYPTTLDAEGQGRVFFVTGEVTTTLEGLHITGGDATGLGGGWDLGGGVYLVTGTLAISGNHIFGNTASHGGGLCLDAGTATLSDNAIISNTARFGAGLVVLDSAVSMNGNRVISNVADYEGGGLALDSSDARLDHNQISANTATHYYGGGITAHQSTITLTASTLSSNTAGLAGGGLFLFNNSQATLISNTIATNTAYGDCSLFDSGGGVHMRYSDATLIGNTIVSNTACHGGGLAWGDRLVTLSNNVIMSNTARIAGGGIAAGYGGLASSGDALIANVASYGGGLALLYADVDLTNTVIVANRVVTASSGMDINASSLRMLHATIANNTGGDGVGVYLDPRSTALLTNTVLAGQALGITATAGSTTTLDGVLWFGNGANTAGQGVIAVTHAYTGDPVFTSDGYHLSAGSAAINRGVPAGVSTDIDGQSRDFAPDLGADEYPLDEKTYLPVIWRSR